MTSQTLARIELFKHVPARDLTALDRQCIWRHFDSGERIVERNDPTTSVYFVTQGEVRVIFSDAGKTVILGETRAGGHFGELAALDARPRSASVIAMTHATLGIMPAGIFLDTLRRHPEVAVALLSQLGEWVRALSTRVYEFSALKVESRMCAELLRLAETRLRADNRAIISPPPVHADLANRIGTRREAVTRAINRLSRQGIVIRRRGAWEVADMARLSALATSEGPTREGSFEGGSANSNAPAQHHDLAHAPQHKLDADGVRRHKQAGHVASA